MKKLYCTALFILFSLNIYAVDKDKWGFNENFELIHNFYPNGINQSNKYNYFAYFSQYNDKYLFQFTEPKENNLETKFIVSDNLKNWDSIFSIKSAKDMQPCGLAQNNKFYFLAYFAQNISTENSCIYKIEKNNINIIKKTNFNFKDIALFNNLIIFEGKGINNNDLIYAYYSRHIVKSVDGGETWDTLKIGFQNKLDSYCYIAKYNNDNNFIVFEKVRNEKVKLNTVVHLFNYDGKEIEKYTLPYSYKPLLLEDKNNFFVLDEFRVYDQSNPKYSDVILKLDLVTNKIDTIHKIKKHVADMGSTMFSLSDGRKFFAKGVYHLLLSDYNNTVFTPINDTNKVKQFDYISVCQGGDNSILVMSYTEGVLFKYNPVVDVKEHFENFSTSVFPNPTRNGQPLYISLRNEKIRTISINIYDETGNFICVSPGINLPIGNHTIDYTPSSISSGTYFIVIYSNGEVLGREKFIIVE